MPLKRKFQVFVSSTFTDLKEERQAAVEAILDAGHIPAGMELFAANNEAQMDIIKRWIDESDVYMLLLGGRYGSIGTDSEKSYTHLEYEYAQSIRIPSFTVVLSEKFIEDKVSREGSGVRELADSRKYNEFRESLLANSVVERCDDVKDIKLGIAKALREYDRREEIVGWVRGDEASSAAEMAVQLTHLLRENSDLKATNERLQSQGANTTPLPVIRVTPELFWGISSWYRMRTQDASSHLQFIPTGISPRAEEVEREGFWLKITVHNSGTLATGIALLVECHHSIMSREDIEAFDNRLSDLDAMRPVKNGWRSIKQSGSAFGRPNDINGIKAQGVLSHLRPGEHRTFEIPVEFQGVSLLVNRPLRISVHPDTGEYLEQSVEWKALVADLPDSQTKSLRIEQPADP